MDCRSLSPTRISYARPIVLLFVVVCFQALSGFPSNAVEPAGYNPKRLADYYKSREWSKARGELDKLLSVRANDVAALQSRAYCNTQLGKYQSAVDDLSRAILVKGDNPDLWLMRAALWKRIGNDKKAKSDLAVGSRIKTFLDSRLPVVSNPTGKVIGMNVSHKGHTFATNYETKHLVVFSDCNQRTTQALIEPLEGFLCFVDKTLCPIKGTYPLTAYLLEDQDAMGAFMKSVNVSSPARSLYGMYVPGMNAIFSYEHSGFGTLTHELMHKVLDGSIVGIDAWANEGIPTVFEKTYGYPTNSGWTFSYGYQNPWRLRALDGDWNSLQLSDIVKNARMGSGDNESKERLVATFLNDSGYLPRYFELIRSGDKKGYDTYLEAAFSSPLEKLEPRFQRFLAIIRERWKDLLEIPSSQPFVNEAAYQKFVSENAGRFRRIVP